MQEIFDFVQQNMILSVVWAGLIVALVMNIIKSSTAGYKEVDTQATTLLINRENGVVVDVRTKDEFKKGHITDSVHILPSEIKDGSFGSLENKKSDPIIVVCKTGQTAVDNANLLAKAGFEKVFVLKHGLTSWSDANLPLVRAKKEPRKKKQKALTE
ncbi:rhodanese-like domain-containing protein [Vibrio breoganii]|uniref:Rhodanese-like domain-containing protein n=1 Tax=Vibrio breoganii TaxID=553239 RepID=A0AAP8SX42_9VIBR|nr:rhodanese-like domain-containing protein [Vibrio breoganii]NMO72815.1 rhodanese-like domain-containing protein [Vibrio breoganii]NMR70007.1 rhodanese-like domain-containing protein [Vibrio breoganii]OCH77112.1 rhodanese-like domain-containing protein [Vibrio breoganii]OED95916.1 rhodanese-like domain-containing protein [Vibrio breoganii ZF-29]OEF82302.1 rhodanese-like domain-containing protein [Vibrio breoganii 1C10]